MSKRSTLQQEVIQELNRFLEGGDEESFMDYVAANSNLPGPRGNLELAGAFEDTLAGYPEPAGLMLWDLCTAMASHTANHAPTNDPREFIAFCGTVGVGALGATWPALFDPAVTLLRQLANDPRWRMREAVAMGLQRLLVSHKREVLDVLEYWVSSASPLELRAAAAAVAEPALLKDEETVQRALRIHRRIVERVAGIETRRSEDFRVLRQALGYTLSVVVQAIPEPGFAFMRALATIPDKDIHWIVRENLKKTRLRKYFPQQVEAVTAMLEAGT
jgi:hypothetical protein